MASVTDELSTVSQVTGMVLAGGRARRMGGEDKGLVLLDGRAMIDFVLAALRPQVATVLINANRNRARYEQLGAAVIADSEPGFLGPLAGMLSGMQAAATPLLLSVPCDSPFVPTDLAGRLHRAKRAARARIAVAHDGERLQPVFALLDVTLQGSLHDYLASGERKIDRWYGAQGCVEVDFSDTPAAFHNINTPEEKEAVERALRDRGNGQ